MFYLVCETPEERSDFIKHLKVDNIHAVHHYLSLHKSDFYIDKHDGRNLPNSDRFSDCLIRLPMFFDITDGQLLSIIHSVNSFFNVRQN
jgi:dTDP-4-amino-4,6-dideoxygalactose transaminase